MGALLQRPQVRGLRSWGLQAAPLRYDREPQIRHLARGAVREEDVAELAGGEIKRVRAVVAVLGY